MPAPLSGLVGFMVGSIGDLTNLIANAVATYGQHLIGQATQVGTGQTMDILARGIYDREGVIYFWNEKIIWFLAQINNVADWGGFGAFLTALADAGLI